MNRTESSPGGATRPDAEEVSEKTNTANSIGRESIAKAMTAARVAANLLEIAFDFPNAENTSQHRLEVIRDALRQALGDMEASR